MGEGGVRERVREYTREHLREGVPTQGREEHARQLGISDDVWFPAFMPAQDERATWMEAFKTHCGAEIIAAAYFGRTRALEATGDMQVSVSAQTRRAAGDALPSPLLLLLFCRPRPLDTVASLCLRPPTAHAPLWSLSIRN